MSDLLNRSLGNRISCETVFSASVWLVFVDPSQLENSLLNLAPTRGRNVGSRASDHQDDHRSFDEPSNGQPEQQPQIRGDIGWRYRMRDVRGVRDRAFESFFTTKDPEGTVSAFRRFRALSLRSGELRHRETLARNHGQNLPAAIRGEALSSDPERDYGPRMKIARKGRRQRRRRRHATVASPSMSTFDKMAKESVPDAIADDFGDRQYRVAMMAPGRPTSRTEHQREITRTGLMVNRRARAPACSPRLRVCNAQIERAGRKPSTTARSTEADEQKNDDARHWPQDRYVVERNATVPQSTGSPSPQLRRQSRCHPTPVHQRDRRQVPQCRSRSVLTMSTACRLFFEASQHLDKARKKVSPEISRKKAPEWSRRDR